MYGAIFAERNGVNPNDGWIEAVSQLTDRQIIRGLESLKEGKAGDSDRECEALRRFPPNEIEFRAVCRRHHPMDAERILPSPDSELWAERQSALHQWGIPLHRTEGMSLSQVRDLIFEHRFGVKVSHETRGAA